jgi:hypothetical protein
MLHTRVTQRVRRRALMAVTAATATVGVLSVAPAALASGGYAAFANCPIKNPATFVCVVAKAEGGEFTIGKKTVPIKHTITLEGGIHLNEETGVESLIAPTTGETLSKTPQTVPGGLIGIEGLGGEVTATTELAGEASAVTLNTENLLGEKGTALSLPVKLKLGNVFLGNNCYGGSNSHPIVLNLTTGETSPPGPNKPIKGKRGNITTEEGGEIVVVSENSLVNNSFGAPGVQGCGLVPPIVDPLVDVGFGVPAGEGHNTAILTGTLRLASAESVAEHS